MKWTIVFSFLLLPFISFSQQKTKCWKINYEGFNNGEPNGNKRQIYYDGHIVFLSQKDDKIQRYTNFKRRENISIIEQEGDLFKLITPFDSLPRPTIEETGEFLLDYKCKKAVYSYFSNKIEVWYTEEAPARGSLFERFIPSENALVLKFMVNGNRETRAVSIEKIKNATLPEYQADKAKVVNDAQFEELKINSRFTVFPVFKNETINFDNSIKAPSDLSLETDKIYRLSKGSVILKKINIAEIIKDNEYVFARLSCRSDGDAYDRTGSIFIIPEKDNISMIDALFKGLENVPFINDNQGFEYRGITRTDNYDPPIELMRFFTSFGADHFNELRKINNYPWEKEAIYEQDITELIPSNSEEIWIGIFIGNYDKGGHKVSLDLHFYPSFGDATPKKKYMLPLFSTVNIMEMSGQRYGRLFNNDTLEVNFRIKDEIQNLRLLFTTTGHGGWGGGDEFNPKLNQIYIDGKLVFEIVPWRTDCATYRLYNPASGNFGNGLSSSDLSRSNWCPATLTPPFIVPVENLGKGHHKLKLVIDQGEDEGSSFSHWYVSGVLVGEQVN